MTISVIYWSWKEKHQISKYKKQIRDKEYPIENSSKQFPLLQFSNPLSEFCLIVTEGESPSNELFPSS